MTATEKMMSSEGAAQPAVPRVLCDVPALLADAGPDAASGIAWRLQEPGRQLDANVVHLAPEDRVDIHTEADLDVLVLIMAGEGTLRTDDGEQPLRPGVVVWLPRGATRGLTAGGGGLAYVTVHSRRQGLRIRRPGE